MVKLVKRIMVSQRKGFTLVEVLIALSILGLIGVSVMSALNVSNRTVLTSREQTVAESLTRSIIEDLKLAPYKDVDDVDGYVDYFIGIETDDDIKIDLTADPYYSEYRIGDEPDEDKVTAVLVDSDDDGLQKLTIKVYYLDNLVSITEAYKAKR